MSATEYASLLVFFERFADNAELQALRSSLDTFQPDELSHETIEKPIQYYLQALPLIEKAIWSSTPDEHLISKYQEAFRELERLIALRGNDNRHNFIIVIPVADRPQHLSQCLDSLLTLCQLYQYGGFIDSAHNKISVIVADDSKQHDNIEQHRNICAEFNKQGLVTEYFGIDEQIDQINRTQCHDKIILRRILGNYATHLDRSSFYHKGAAITRNIAYLRVNQIINESKHDKHLTYFIDSDQEFKIIIPHGYEQRDLFAINYFHHLNEIFTHTNARILTGKVVGDPPVSPSVMAANFQDDVIGFLKKMSTLKPDQNCCLHTDITHKNDDAAYHDMANLFGFDKHEKTFEYHCTLPLPHNHVACFIDFSNKLNRFFDGEHPTRSTYFNYETSFSDTIPARTIYTGNYVFKPECLKFFIAFATLKLRMAGPVLGRIIRSEIQNAFVSANLPMLHKRTIDNTGQSEFRPGVKHDRDNIDLSGEFERQFYGDIMLFTIDKLVQLGFPVTCLPDSIVEKTLEETATEMYQLYQAKHEQIVNKLSVLISVFRDDTCWWHKTAALDSARANFTRFINNIEHNFGNESKSYALISSTKNRKKRHIEILQAITGYSDDRVVWMELLQ